MEYNLNFTNELIVDNFAGGGGASIGIEMGSNRFVDIAINHDEKAISVHKLNHPHTKHIKSDVFEVDPEEVCGGKPVGLAWFSPDCTHFSKAKGGKPVEKKIRGLAWVARKWAKVKKPRVIILENVEEFLTWGPIVDGKPDPKRKGLTFWAFNQWFLRNGYKTDWKILKACDYGAPTIRKRFFWIARCDDQKIVWPESTHGPKNSVLVKKKKLKPYRTAAECIDFSITCPSIFMDKDEVKIYNKKNKSRIRRPLKEKTLTRLAKGIVKFVLNEKGQFIVPIANCGSGCVVHSGKEPLRTITDSPKRGAFALCSPFIAPIANYSSGVVVDSGQFPIRTMTARNNLAVCTPYIARHFGQSIGSDIKEPIGSITSGGGGKTQLITPIIARQFKSGVCHSVKQPLATVMANGGGGKNQLVSAFLAKHYTGVVGSDLKKPLGTVTAVDHHSLVTATLSKEEIHSGVERVFAFLMKYYGQGLGQNIKEPLHTLSTKDRFALVTVRVGGESYLIVDIGMRMLQPHELLIAQGFPPDYNLGDNTKTTKVRLIGNSVPPPFSEALVRSNYNTLGNYKKSA